MNFNLEGKTFSREIKRDGSFGQPKGIAYHQVSFENGTMFDNADTFFGSPPSRESYKVNGNSILASDIDEPEVFSERYIIDGDTIKNTAGAVLRLKK